MDKIIPDDIISLTINTSIEYKNDVLNYEIHVVFMTVDNVVYDVSIFHRRDSSIMICRVGDEQYKYYFSPYISQRYLKFILMEYAKGKPTINHKNEIIALINKVIQHNLACKEVNDEETE